MPGAKKKHGKDGGVVAAVNKHAAGRFSQPQQNDDQSDSPAPASDSPASPPVDAQLDTSPTLDAVSTTTAETSASPNTRDWARNIPPLGTSPGNLISLVGESPPTQPSSFEDRLPIRVWASPTSRPSTRKPAVSASPPVVNRGSFMPTSPPPVPAGRRPISFHLDHHVAPSEAYTPSAASFRRSSMHSPASYRGLHYAPPLPHLAQPHFYGTPELDVNLGQQQPGMTPGDRHHVFRFDHLPGASRTSSVVLAGYEGGLDILSVHRKGGLSSCASLRNLRGGVTEAAILPWACDKPGLTGPLVVVVIHGPQLASREADIYQGCSDPDDVLRRTEQAADASTPIPVVESYQTTVEIFSLLDGQRKAAIMTMRPVPLSTPITSPYFQPPPPSDDLRLLVSSEALIVASGQTGECWVFRQHLNPHSTALAVRCVGKLWTSLQPVSQDSAVETDKYRAAATRPTMRAPIIALEGRWIAYCPSAPTTHSTLDPVLLVPALGKAPGLATTTPPQLPTVVSDVELPDADSIMNKIMRETTQELLQGAKWVGERGLQAFNNYWNKSAASSQPLRSPPASAPLWGSVYGTKTSFPPTHGPVRPAVSKEPGLVSIADLESSFIASSFQPIVTFATTGCSFLSFSPNGLSLFTASTKGDVQSLWDLMRIRFTKSSPLQPATAGGANVGPRVRRVAQFSRLTVARIVDVSWAKPNGGSMAMVTERGTVHFLDLPISSLMWPPPRRRNAPAEAEDTDKPKTTVALASNAISTAFDVARPLVSRPRRSSNIVPQTTGARVAEHATQGGRMLAAGISQSLGKTGSAINQLRHRADNRISLPIGKTTPGTSCVVFARSRHHHSLFVLGDGIIRAYPPRLRKPSTNGKQAGSRFGRYQEFKIPALPDDLIAASVRRLIEPEEYLDLIDKDAESPANAPPLLSRPKGKHYASSAGSSIPNAEVESSAPYQPFHTDRRVALYEYGNGQNPNTSDASSELPTVSILLTEPELEDNRPKGKNRKKTQAAPTLLAVPVPTKQQSRSTLLPWAFGQPLVLTRLDTGHRQFSKQESMHMSTDETRALPQSALERSVLRQGEDGEQLVITTRRRRGGWRDGEGDDDGFFEDDCEVLDFADQRV